MYIPMSPKQQELHELSSALAERFAERAAGYDDDNAFPEADFADLREHNLLTLTLPEDVGGRGVGIHHGDPWGLWLTTKNIARGNSATGQCIQVHTNMAQLIVELGTEEQRRQFLQPIVDEGAILAGWALRHGAAKPVADGWVINGGGEYATNAERARWVLLLAAEEGDPDRNRILSLMVPMDDPGITINPQWWANAAGMRATTSHELELRDVFVPKSQLIGYPGAYRREEFQTKLHPQFSANFIGTGESAYRFALGYLEKRGKTDDPYVQMHVGRMRLAIDTATSILYQTALAWLSGDAREAHQADMLLRVLADEHAQEVVHLAIRACGATSLMRNYPLERILRDLSFYCGHENKDAILANLGKASMGLGFHASGGLSAPSDRPG